jgi:ribosomal-protein-alanine N-acetyltransferase
MSANPSAGILVRPMCAADLYEVMEIAGSLKELPQWLRLAYVAALDPDAVPQRIALVSQEAEQHRILCFAVASLLAPQSELEIIAVDARFQRRGLARKLFEELADELALTGVTEVVLEVRASNQAALALYRVLGFVETGRRPRYYADPQEDAVQMRLQLK